MEANNFIKSRQILSQKCTSILKQLVSRIKLGKMLASALAAKIMHTHLILLFCFTVSGNTPPDGQLLAVFAFC